MKCTPPKLEPGGGGVNVARAVKKLGGQAIAIFPSGGYTGRYFDHLLEKENIPVVIIEAANETRENIIVFDESTGNQYRFGIPGTELHESEWKQCLKAIAESDNVEFIVASGSLPPGVPLNIYAQIARIAKSKNAKLIVDTSGEALKHAADEGVYLLKPNLAELATLTGIKDISIHNVESIARKFIVTKNCSIIVVSLGEMGALLVTKDEMHRVIPPVVTRKSTVGAGDSMVAGIVFSLTAGMSLKEALQFGVACGTAATMNSGTELCNAKDAEELFKRIKINAAEYVL